MILICYGTRPEIIKLFPVIEELRHRQQPFKTLFTGQHLDLYQDVKELIPNPDVQLATMSSGHSLAHSFSTIVSAVERALCDQSATIVMVQGDTTTACAIAITAFYLGIPVAHVEAGLRSDDMAHPFPEEANRRLITQVASYNFAPTETAYCRLQKEGARNIYLTGNTIVDALNHFALKPEEDPIVVITIHRRENHAQMDKIFLQINQAAVLCPELTFVFPIHPNPNVQRHRGLLTAANVQVTAPVGYPQMLSLVSRCRFIISDSGGLQEEAVYFGKKIIIVRKTTERPETIDCGLGRLVDNDIIGSLNWALSGKVAIPSVNPYGDGKSAKRMVDLLSKHLP